VAMNAINKVSVQALVITILLGSQAYADDSSGIIRVKSNHDVSTTIDKLENVLTTKGMTIFKRINHTTGAEKAGLQLRPTELLIFGNPRIGTPLMLCSQTMALDLPQKALAYEDESGQVWLAYNSPEFMASRHGINNCEETVKKVSHALTKFTSAATK